MNAIVIIALAFVASAACKPVTESALSSSSSTTSGLPEAPPSANPLAPGQPLPDDPSGERLPLHSEDADDADLEPWEDETNEDLPEAELGAEEGMQGAENVAFRPLFVYRKREARRAAERAARQRRARGSERVGYFAPYARTYRRSRQRPAYLNPQRPAYLRPLRQDPPLQILY